MVLHTSNPRAWKVKARESGVHGYAELHETLSQEKESKKEKKKGKERKKIKIDAQMWPTVN